METQLVERSGIPFRTIPAAGVHGIGLRTLPRNLWQLSRGVFASRRILREFKPDVLFFTGGYVAVPMALAGWKVPSLLYVPDIEPGLALNTLARFADKIAVTAEDSLALFSSSPERITLTGYPVRADLARWTRQAARKALNLSEESPVLLVFGGSKGARSINTAVMASLPALVEMAQIVHITGELDWPNVEEKAKNFSKMHSLKAPLLASLPSSPPATTPSRTCTSRWAPPWPRPTWHSAVPELPHWANIRSSACRRYWCPTRMPGVTRKSMPITSSGMPRQSCLKMKNYPINSCRP